MRYAVLVTMGLFGGFLLWAAQYRYQAVNLQLAHLNSVEAVVTSVGPDDDLHLKYAVGSTPYEIVRSVGVNLFPSIKAGDKVLLAYDTARPDTATLRHWSETYQDSAVAGGFGVVAIVMAVAVFVIMGSGIKGDAVRPPQAVAVVTTLDRPIELKNAGSGVFSTLVLAVGIFGAAFLLYRNPDFMWSRYLSYPVATLIALFGGFLAWSAFFTKAPGIHADQRGIVVNNSDGGHQFLWEDIAALKHEIVTQEVVHRPLSQLNSHKNDFISTTEEVAHTFVLLDSSGKELLKLNEDVPMKPFEDWMRLRGYIRGRTGLPVEEAIRESPQGPREAS
jgi:hypothetical protein